MSDNCSFDETVQVVEELRDNRVRYFFSEKALSMPDSWEFALGHARGEWITFLCDDDAICPGLLRRISGVIQLDRYDAIIWLQATYFHGDHPIVD